MVVDVVTASKVSSPIVSALIATRGWPSDANLVIVGGTKVYAPPPETPPSAGAPAFGFIYSDNPPVGGKGKADVLQAIDNAATAYLGVFRGNTPYLELDDLADHQKLTVESLTENFADRLNAFVNEVARLVVVGALIACKGGAAANYPPTAKVSWSDGSDAAFDVFIRNLTQLIEPRFATPVSLKDDEADLRNAGTVEALADTVVTRVFKPRSPFKG